VNKAAMIAVAIVHIIAVANTAIILGKLIIEIRILLIKILNYI
jgi:hypothetical protein